MSWYECTITTQPVEATSEANRIVNRSTGEMIQLGWILTRNKLITPPQLEIALTTQRMQPKKLGELLMEQRLISEDQLRDALREQTIRRRGHWVI